MVKQKLTRSESGKLGGIKSSIINKEKKDIRINEYNKNTKKCINCNSDLEYKKRKNKFCSKSCSASYNNRGVSRNSRNIIKGCLNCNLKFKGRYNRLYCSNKCQIEYQRNIKFDKIKNGIYSGNTRFLKKYLIEIRGHRCEECKNTEWLGNPINLELEHINGDSSDNNLINLKLLCPNCHSYTPTYKGKNIGNSKRERGRYYKRRGK